MCEFSKLPPVERVIWTTRHDGLVHWATIIRNEAGHLVWSDCGQHSNAYWERFEHFLVEITCPKCRAMMNTNAVSHAA